MNQIDPDRDMSEGWSTNDWRQETRDWSETAHLMATVAREKSFKNRISFAKSFYDDIAYLEFICWLHSLSDQALDKALESYKETHSQPKQVATK